MLDTKELNDEIPCNHKHFTKRKDVLTFETKPTTNNTRKVKK